MYCNLLLDSSIIFVILDHSKPQVVLTCWRCSGSQRLKRGKELDEQVERLQEPATDSILRMSSRIYLKILLQKYSGKIVRSFARACNLNLSM